MKPGKPLERRTALARSTTPMKRSGPIARTEGPRTKRKAINPVSKKRQRENVERRTMLEEAWGPRRTWRCQLRDDPSALAALGPCRGEVNGHEIIKASAWRAGRLELSNIIPLCNRHNDAVEDFPNAARLLGLSKRRQHE